MQVLVVSLNSGNTSNIECTITNGSLEASGTDAPRASTSDITISNGNTSTINCTTTNESSEAFGTDDTIEFQPSFIYSASQIERYVVEQVEQPAPTASNAIQTTKSDTNRENIFNFTNCTVNITTK